MEEFRNTAYWSSFRDFFNKLFLEINKMSESDIPKDFDFMPKLYKNGHQYKLEEKPNIHSLMNMLNNKIDKWREHDQLVANAEIPGCYGKTWAADKVSKFDVNFIPSIAHELYIKAGNSFHITDKHLSEQYQLIENALYLEKYKYRIVSPLYNIEIQANKVEISDGVFLRKIEKKDLLLFRPTVHIPYMGSNAYDPFLKTVIVTEDIRDKGAPSGISPKIYELFTDVVAALSIFLKDTISFGPIYSKPENFWCATMGVVSIIFNIDTYSRMRSVHTIIKDNDMPEFISFCSAYIDFSRSNKWLSICNRRLSKLSNETNQEDKICDMITLLEILFLPKEEGELNYRLCVRCAKFIGKDSKSSQEIFNLLKIAYKIRSDIVHNGVISENSNKKLSKLRISIFDLNKKIESLLLDSLHKFGLNPDQRNNIDAYLF